MKRKIIHGGNLPLSFLEQLKNREYKTPKEWLVINNVNVKIVSERYGCFKKSQECFICGLNATHLSIEKNELDNSENFHINMYCDDILFHKHLTPNFGYKPVCTVCKIKHKII